MAWNFCIVLVACCLSTSFCEAKPIMVEFGTSKGPILPPSPPTTAATAQSRSLVVRSPAPVREERDDVPNPNQYRAPVPHQYRTNIYSFKPTPNLILGTPLDIKYTPSLEKYNLHRKQYSRTLDQAYTGPHLFDKQEYEFIPQRKTILKPSQSYSKTRYNQNNKVVPQIGVIYSGGVRYYVPQIFYYQQNERNANEDQENSVYDRNDEKYYHYSGNQ